MPTGRQTFDCERMEDVLQEHETKVSASGAQNELDGKAVRAIVVPGVIKRGNGEGGVDGDWESETVVAKTRVLV